MLIAARDMYGVPLQGSDGRVGTLYDLLFDDRSWRLRHLVVSIDRWLLGQQVLIAPETIRRADWPAHRLSVPLSKEEIRHSPSAESDEPVSRRQARAAAQVLVWEAYWANIAEASDADAGDPHLRSTKMLTGLHLHCTDGQLGHVEDFIIDDQQWSIRELVADTRNWWPGKRVLIEPTLIEAIYWEDREVRLSLRRDEVEHRPAYEHHAPTESSMVGSA